MKKIYVLMAAACVAASASAVKKETAAPVKLNVDAKFVKEYTSPIKLSNPAFHYNGASLSKMGAKAPAVNGEYAYYRAADDVMAIGNSTNGYGYNAVTFGFVNSNAPITFLNYSTGYKGLEWSYSDINDYEIVGDQVEWNIKSSDAEDLVLKSGVGELPSPDLYVTYNSGHEDVYTRDYFIEYLCGGSAYYWLGGDDEVGVNGVTFYQNNGLQSPQGYSGALTYRTSYALGDNKYNKNGVYTDQSDSRNWQAVFDDQFGTPVSNLTLDNFTVVLPAPGSTYYMTKGWGSINVTATKATQLMSYIYPIDEDGIISDTPIALGYAAIAKGENYMVVFDYNPLDENGDELEGEIEVNTAIAITIEGFQGNKVIREITPASGYYPFSYESYSADQNYDICKEPDLLMQFSMTVDGEQQTVYAYDRGLYYFDQADKNRDEDTLSLLSYAKFNIDASFNFIYAENGEESVNLPLEGGEVDVEISAYYYNISELKELGVYEITAPEWLSVGVGEADSETGLTTLTLAAEACEAPGRSGVLTIEGMGATFNLEVVQGESGSVNVVVANPNAVYYDLAGRQVNNPEKGIYIRKNGNKSEKVVF